MSISDYLHPIELTAFDIERKYISDEHTFYHVDKLSKNSKIEDYDIAILGIEEERNTTNKGCKLAPDSVREQFYKLMNNTKLRIIDLGNLKLGKTLKDTYFAIADITFELINQDVFPIIIGGSQDLSYGMYNGLDRFNRLINFVSIDSKLDLGYEKNDFDSESYLGQIILEKGKNLFNFSNLGHQSYFCSTEELKLINKMKFDAYRLGYIRSHIADAEPILRDANLLSIDIKSIKQSDAPGHKTPMPNGFYSEEVCQLARYAGISDNLKCVGLFEVNPEYDLNNQTSALAAQIIWHFIDGFANRENDFPNDKDSRYTQHIVSLDKSEQDIIFYQNNHNKRWWLVVPNPQNNKKTSIVACTQADYEMAVRQEIPEKWINTINKLM